MVHPMSDVLRELQATIEQRIAAGGEGSYVASLHQKGLNKILEKVGEESTETILAAKDASVTGDHSELVYETADLWFHTLVMLSELGIGVDELLSELERRMGTSGIEEKASRSK